jgi:intracellular protein transport protein USO1
MPVPGKLEFQSTWILVHHMEFLSQTYVALRGPTGAPQTAADTVGKLTDRLSPATLLADRRAAVLALKGLARDHKQDVGERALPGLLQVLYNDAEVDSDIGKAVLETLGILCDVEDGTGKELGLRYTDAVLESEQALHVLLGLLADNSFYTRFSTLQFLSILLRNRRQRVQSYFLTAQTGPRSIVAVLEDKREIIRNGKVYFSLFVGCIELKYRPRGYRGPSIFNIAKP